MKIVHDIGAFVPEGKTALTIGKFDGLHRGHAMLLRQLQSLKAEGLRTAVLVVPAFRKQQELLDPEELVQAFADYDPDYLVFLPDGEDFFSMSAEAFIRELLIGRMQAAVILSGKDFRFGRKRIGDAALLRDSAAAYGYRYLCFDRIRDGEEEISSTAIRNHLKEGDVKRASELLGYPYRLTGEIVHGRHLGTGLGFPTANLIPDPAKFLPRFGVYAVRALMEGKLYGGLANLGVKPSIEDRLKPSLEVHLMHAEGDFYGKQLEVRFLKFLRDEQRFENLEALQNQVLRDLREAENHFSSLISVDKND